MYPRKYELTGGKNFLDIFILPSFFLNIIYVLLLMVLRDGGGSVTHIIKL